MESSRRVPFQYNITYVYIAGLGVTGDLGPAETAYDFLLSMEASVRMRSGLERRIVSTSLLFSTSLRRDSLPTINEKFYTKQLSFEDIHA